MNQGSNVPPPTPADFVPPGESTNGAIGGDSVMFSRADHSHPRLTSATNVTLDGTGTATVAFTRTFSTAPTIGFAHVPPFAGGPCVFAVDSWIPSSGLPVTGCVVKGYRLSAPTALANVSVLGISVTVGGQTITTYGPANGAAVSVIALMSS